MKVLVLNCGSSSAKFQLFETHGMKFIAGGMVERIGFKDAVLSYYPRTGENIKNSLHVQNHEEAIDLILKTICHPEYGVLDNIHQIDPAIECEIFSQRLEIGSMEEPFITVDIVVEALDSAETKTQFIEEIITHLPNTPLIAASGVAGIGHSDRMKTIRSGNLYLVYDEQALSSDEDVLLAPKVCLMANWQANLVLEILLGDYQWE